jgi:hypothetical protein
VRGACARRQRGSPVCFGLFDHLICGVHPARGLRSNSHAVSDRRGLQFLSTDNSSANLYPDAERKFFNDFSRARIRTRAT